MKINILIIIFLLTSGSIFSQSLDSLLNEAMQRNFLIKSSQSMIEAKKSKIDQASALPSPTLSLEISQFNFEKVDIINNALSNSISISQMFPIGGKLSAMKKVAESDMRLSLNRHNELKNELISKIKMKYYELWKVEREIELQKQNIDQLRNLESSLNLLYQISKVGQSEIILVQSEIAKSEVELLNLDRKRNTLLKEINFLIGRENLNQEIVIDKNLKLKEINLSADQLDSLIILMNPELKSIQSMIEMNKNEIDANRRELIPDLMFSGMIMRMPKGMILTTKTFPMVTDAREEIMFGVMASINLPFVTWAKKKITHKIEELENNIRSIEYERMNMIQQMRKEIQSLLLSMETNKDLIKLYEEKVLPSFENVYKLQLTELETGRISINSIVETNRMSLMEKMKYLMAILEYQMAFVELEKIIGQNLIKEYEK